MDLALGDLEVEPVERARAARSVLTRPETEMADMLHRDTRIRESSESCKVREVTDDVGPASSSASRPCSSRAASRACPRACSRRCSATDSGRLTAAELAELLQISPAAVSGAVRYLTQVEPDQPRARARLTARRLPPARRPLVRGDRPARAAAAALGARGARGRRRASAPTRPPAGGCATPPSSSRSSRPRCRAMLRALARYSAVSLNVPSGTLRKDGADVSIHGRAA